MQIKTFRALDMREALRMIKAELGPDAVILSSQEVKKGSGAFGLFSRTMVEVTAAVDRGGDTARPSPARSSDIDAWNGDVHEDRAAILSHGRLGDAQRPLTDMHSNSGSPQLPGRTGFSPAPVKANHSFSDHMYNATEMQALRGELAVIKQQLSGLRDLTAPLAGAHDAWKGFEQDVRSAQRLVGTLAKNERESFVHRLPPPLRAIYDRLLTAGVDADVVLDLVKQLPPNLPADDQQLATVALRMALSRQVSQSVTCAGPLLQEQSGAQAPAKVVMIVGPTGVGKTTTIAKLAAHYALQLKRKVALITLDTYRVAAVEQLRVYGNILGLAVDVALTCEDLAGMLRLRKNADLILIDTAGRSPLDQAAFRELKKLVVLHRQVEAHLVLSAGMRESDLALVLPRFASLPVKSLIFSKLDETTHYGTLFTVLHRTRLPVSYLSAGQRVPEDLTLATSTLVTDLLVDGLSAVKMSSAETSPLRTGPTYQPARLPAPRLTSTAGSPTLHSQPRPALSRPVAPQPAKQTKNLFGVLGRVLRAPKA